MKRIPTGCRAFDDLLGGGIEAGSVTLIYGEAGTGKSNICLQTARNLMSGGKKVAYIDAEGLSKDRMFQVLGSESVSDLLVFEVHSLEEQSDKIDKVAKLAEMGVVELIVVDSMTMYYRLNHDDQRARNDFMRQIEVLLGAARKSGAAVLLTSQVYSNISTGAVEFLGGHTMYHNSKTIIRLDKKGNGVRSAVVIKHRSLPEGRHASYRITATGIGDV